MSAVTVGFMEPESRIKRELMADRLSRIWRRLPAVPEAADLAALKGKLRAVRELTRDNLLALADELKSNVARESPRITWHQARDGDEAATCLLEIAGGLKVVSTNNSGVVSREIRRALLSRGLTIINSYLNEFDVPEKAFPDYWGLPNLLDNGLGGGFSVTTALEGLRPGYPPPEEPRPYLAVLGANAVATDGSAFFLQHLANILRDFQQAEKVVIVVALDKITSSREDAALITECMGIFGMESLLLGIQPKAPQATVAGLPALASGARRELHLLLLDNGRSRLPGSVYQDLLLCIGCRACNRHCPIRHSFNNDDYLWTPRNYLAEFMDGKSISVDTCLHCEACRVHCPLDIDLPGMMWMAKNDPAHRRGRSISHYVLGMPELLASLGSFFAPASNLALGLKPVRQLMERVVGLDRRTHLPAFHRQTFRGSFREEGR